jgi:hypothetical protein
MAAAWARVVTPELGQQAVHVVLHGVHGDVESLRDIAVRPT